MDGAIEANKKLLKQHPNKIILNKENCLPHISLAMGCINQKNIDEVQKILREIADKYLNEPLNVTGVHIETNLADKKVSVLKVEKTRTLQSLHEQIMQKLAVFFSNIVTSNMLLGDKPIDESTLLWIKNYSEKSSYVNFFPHITLGYGELKNEFPQTKFTVTKLALCHLGNHCTCRKVLATAELTK
jgi:2'-5' RNA ligase